MTDAETIAAIATPGGTGAVALIRVSGAGARATVADACRCGADFADRSALLKSLRDADGRVLDRVLVTSFRGPRSYTGEDVVEVSTHGGRHITRRVLERLVACGARVAGPGEFTARAFENGKLDLTQAEAVMDLISAQSDLALRAAHEQLEGRIGETTEQLRQDLIDTAAQLEAWIDFPEEDIDPETNAELRGRAEAALGEIRRLLATADQGRILRDGLRTVICGRPNAGKSSLMNALLGSDRAIVSGTAGTTRDTIEEMLVLDGVPLRIVDTAGLRGGGDEIEAEGIRRTLQEAGRADLLIAVVDGTLSAEEAEPRDLPPAATRITVINKADLGEHADWQESSALRVSCTDGQGLEEFRRAIREAAELGEGDWGEHSVAINARHRAELSRAEAALVAALERLGEGAEPEITALDLREAMSALGEIAGRVDVEDILGSIFSRFCIGK